MKFGLELEFGLNPEDRENAERFITSQEGELKSDGSINTQYSHIAREINTKVYSIEELKEVENLFNSFYSDYVKEINKSMGLHIHVSFEKMGDYNALFSRRFIRFFKKKLMDKFGDNQELTKRFNNKYCSNVYPKHYFLGNIDKRHKMINYQAYSKHGTIEFRIFNAPQTAKGVMDYLLFTLETITIYLSIYNKVFIQNVTIEREETPKIELIEVVNSKIEKININGLRC